jgi:hypothetical protein
VECGKPAADAARIDAEELGDFLGRVALQNTLHGKKTPAFQFSG